MPCRRSRSVGPDQFNANQIRIICPRKMQCNVQSRTACGTLIDRHQNQPDGQRAGKFCGGNTMRAVVPTGPAAPTSILLFQHDNVLRPIAKPLAPGLAQVDRLLVWQESSAGIGAFGELHPRYH